MKKKMIITALAALAVTAVSGCSMSADVTPTPTPVSEEPAVTLTVLDDYALLDGHSLYQGKDNAYSIQIPEGSEISDDDKDNVTITVYNDSEYPNTVNIKYSKNAEVIDSETQLMETLKDDNSIDITGFFLLNKDNAYEGYKYTCTAMNDPEFKTIKSIYFSDDRSAYIVTASTPNGGDDINMTNLNTIVDTFINYN